MKLELLTLAVGLLFQVGLLSNLPSVLRFSHPRELINFSR